MQPMTPEQKALVEKVAERMWQNESRRAAGRPRLVSWACTGDWEKDKWCGLATAAIAVMVEEAARKADEHAAEVRRVADLHSEGDSRDRLFARAREAGAIATAIRALAGKE